MREPCSKIVSKYGDGAVVIDRKPPAVRLDKPMVEPWMPCHASIHKAFTSSIVAKGDCAPESQLPICDNLNVPKQHELVGSHES